MVLTLEWKHGRHKSDPRIVEQSQLFETTAERK